MVGKKGSDFYKWDAYLRIFFTTFCKKLFYFQNFNKHIAHK